MKRIIKLRTYLVSVAFVSIFVLTASVIVANVFTPDSMKDNRLIRYLTKNISIQAVVTKDYWSDKYPHNRSAVEQYEDTVSRVEKAIESLCTISFPESQRVNTACYILKNKIYHFNLDNISDKRVDYLYVRQYIDNVVGFCQTLESYGYPFLYVRTPLPASMTSQVGENLNKSDLVYPARAETLTDALVSNGIDVIDFAKTDHVYSFDRSSHWFPGDALYAAGEIAQHLNAHYGYCFDPDTFETTNFQSFLTQYPQTREEISRINSYDFDIPVPVAQTQFTVVYAEETENSGSFTECFIKPEEQWKTDTGAYHNMLSITNSLTHEIYNNTVAVNNDKHILILSDSFDWPLGMYLAMGAGKITLLHNASFTGSIMSYIHATKPDMVIMAYNDVEYMDLYTETAFDLQ